jgi:hypothetical protein
MPFEERQRERSFRARVTFWRKVLSFMRSRACEDAVLLTAADTQPGDEGAARLGGKLQFIRPTRTR